MSQFYGTIDGSARTQATRRGTKSSGLTTHAAGWGGAIRVDVFDRDGIDHYCVTLQPWHNSGGQHVTLAEGILDAWTSHD